MNRNHLIAAAVILAALVGSFSAGRFSAPLKVETRDVERVVFKDRIVEKIVTVEVKAKAETKIVWRDRVITKEGVVTEHEIEKTDTKEDTKKTADVDRVVTRDAERVVTVEKIVTLRPSWRVGVLAGASFQTPLLPIAGPLVLGVEAQYRIAGGLWAGLWTLPQHGAVGASISFEF